MTDDRLEFRIQEEPYGNVFDCALICRDGKRRVSFGSEVIFTPLNDGERIDHPTFKMGRDEARILMDELWRAGIRPTEHGGEGELAAMRNHLADMRRLVFDGDKLRTLIVPSPS